MNRKGEVCWVLIYDLPTGATSTTSCLNEDALPRKDAKCEEITEEVDEVEEFSLTTIAISGVNLLIAVANIISLAKLHCRTFMPKDHPPRRINHTGEKRGIHDRVKIQPASYSTNSTDDKRKTLSVQKKKKYLHPGVNYWGIVGRGERKRGKGKRVGA